MSDMNKQSLIQSFVNNLCPYKIMEELDTFLYNLKTILVCTNMYLDYQPLAINLHKLWATIRSCEPMHPRVHGGTCLD